MAEIRLGYTLACEEHGPRELLRFARRAEEAGFPFAMISDHFHPWTDRQGHSPHVWSVIGGIAAVTERLEVGTAVTCPTVRQHPAIVAQAGATSQAMLEGRFTLGVGTGEALNEQLGQVLPQPAHFEQAAQLVGEDAIAETIACGPDPERHLGFIRRFAEAGYDHVFVHQVGPDQEGFFRFYERDVLPQVRTLAAA